MAYRRVKFFKAVAEFAARRRQDPMFQKLNWPTCDLCGGAEVDKVELVDLNKRYATMRAFHHGSDDAVECLFDWDITEVDLSIPMRGLVFFKPTMDEDRVVSSWVKGSLGSDSGSTSVTEGSDKPPQGGSGTPET